MNAPITNPLRKYLRPGSLPHFFCAGCGSAQILNFFIQAADEINLDFDRLVAIGGVGCTARIPLYINADGLHGIHGRTLPWATGIKLHNPDLQVVIFAGDGDAAAIGGNHLVHAARRNLDVVMIVVNNLTYAMTGGQVAPTTLLKLSTTTTPYGNVEPPFDICKLVMGAGATFVCRTTTNKPRQAINLIKKGMLHKGFSLIEIISQCPTNFGRRAINNEDPAGGVKWIQEQSVMLKDAAGLNEAEQKSRFILGIFVEKDEPVFTGSSIDFDEEEDA